MVVERPEVHGRLAVVPEPQGMEVLWHVEGIAGVVWTQQGDVC